MIVNDDNDMVVDIWNHTLVPYFAMVVVDTVNNTVYMEFENQSEPRIQYYNLSNSTTTQVFNASWVIISRTIQEGHGRFLEITSDGTIKLQGLNTLKNGIIVDPSVMAQSTSGKFLFGECMMSNGEC